MSCAVVSACGITAVDSGTKEATSPCSLSLAFTGPTAAATFSGLNEDSTQCSAASWKAVYEKTAPASGSYFVSESCSGILGRDDGSLTKPYCTIAEAVAAIAQDQVAENFSIHIDGGTYTLGALSHSAAKTLTLRGLCSTKTTLKAQSTSDPIIALATTKAKFTVDGATLSGGAAPLAKITAGTLALANVRVEHGNHNNCFVVSGSAAGLVGKYVAIDGNDSVAVALPTQTAATVTSAMLPVASRDVPICVHVHSGGQLEMTNFHLHDFSGIAMLVEDSGSKATLTDGVVEQIVPFSFNAASDAAALSTYTGMFGYGLAVEEQATATVSKVTFASTYGAALLVDGESTTATVEESYLGGTKADITSSSGVGLIVQRTATGTIKTSTIATNAGPGVFVSAGATATVENNAISNNGFANVAVTDATATIEDNTLSAAQTHASHGGRFNIFLQGLDATRTVTATIGGNVLKESPADLYLVEKNSGAMAVTVDGNLFTGSTGTTSVAGLTQLLNLPTGTTFRTNCFNSTGPFAILLSAANALLEQNVFQGSYSGFVLHQQFCSALSASSPYTVPVTYTGETMPIGAVHCLCNIRSNDGSTCSTVPLGPEAGYDFTVSEVAAIQ